jgi:hypothetical protein
MSLNCCSERNLSNSEHNNSLSSSVDGNVNKTPLPEYILIFGIYASSVFVAIVVVLVITHVVGKPEPDDFWWEDKLAKRSY